MGGPPTAVEAAGYGRGGGVGRVGVGDGVGTGSVGVTTGTVGVTRGMVGVGMDRVGSTPDPVGVGPMPDALGDAAPDGVAPGWGRDLPALAWSCFAARVISGDSGARVWGLSAR